MLAGLVGAASAASLFAAAHLLPFDRTKITGLPVDALGIDSCSPADLAAMEKLPPGRYMTTPAAGVHMLGHAPHEAQAGVLAFHRGVPGMRRLLAGLYFEDAAARRTALAPFDYVLLCEYPAALKAAYDGPPSSAFTALIKDREMPGLLAMPGTGSPTLKLYRIDHDRL